MITRLVCLIFAVGIVTFGLQEQSLALMALAAAIVTLALAGLPDAEPARPVYPLRRLLDRTSWILPALPRPALTTAGLAIGMCLLSVMSAIPGVFSLTSAASWLVAVIAVGVLGPMLDGISWPEIRHRLRAVVSPEHRPEVGSVAAMTLVAFVLRFYQLETIPPMFHGDEGLVGMMGLKILNGQFPPLLAVDAEWPQAYLYTYMTALSMWLFGQGVFGLRMLGIFFGALGVPVVYAIARVGWGPAAGAIAAWLFAVSHLQNHYSRIGTFVIESVPLMALVMLLLALTYERGQVCVPKLASGQAASGAEVREATVVTRRGVWTLMLLAGLTCGFAQYFYYGSRLIPIVVAPLMLLLWRTRSATVWQVVAFAFGFVIIVAPLAAHFVDNPAQFSGRLNEVSLFQDSYVKQLLGPTASLPSALPALLAEQTRRSLHLFVRGGDQGGFYSGNTPIFDVVTSAMMWLGFGAALSRFWRYHEASALIWFGLGILFSSILTLGAYSGQRVLIMTTAGFVFGGVLVARIWTMVQMLPTRSFSWLAAPVGTTLALWLISANVTTYFFEYVPRAEMSEQTAVAREMVTGGDQYRNYFLTSPIFDPNHPSIRFIARGLEATNLRNAGEFKMPPDDGKGIAIIALEMHLAELRALEARLPGGTENRRSAPNGRILYLVYRVPPRG